jgi:hypothetical protein
MSGQIAASANGCSNSTKSRDQRLLKCIASLDALRDERAAYGCPVGDLCQDMMRAGGAAPPKNALAQSFHHFGSMIK